MSTLPSDGHGPDYTEIARRLKDGTIVPFFGAGASVRCGVPSARDLAARLVEEGCYPDGEGQNDLALVASYYVATRGDLVSLRALLRRTLNVSTTPGPLHHCLSSPGFEALRLFVTTNYDDLIERALESRRPWVVVDRGSPGKVSCRAPTGEWEEIESKNLGYKIADKKHPIVLKLHGSLDRHDSEQDSFLVTEEHYVEFLGRPEGGQLPQMLATLMRQRSFLFLGYGLRDWNIRVMLRKLAETRSRSDKIRSWAIVLNPSAVETELWKAQGVELHGVDLDTFVQQLEAAL